MLSPKVTLGQPLTSLQKAGLEWVAQLHGGRDVVLAVDLTESVGLNDEGRIRLRQIAEDALKPGDTVYVVPFASDVSLSGTPIEFHSAQDIQRVLKAVPFQPDLTLYNTDIQRGELTIYQYLAQRNQDRLQLNQPIKPQSVVWVTDAPLLSKPGEAWIETPTNSSFRILNSPESQARWEWVKALDLLQHQRSLPINNYKLTVVDIDPIVQEFCTPIPGGKETCLINPYLIRQLWLPSVLLVVALIIALGSALRFLQWWLGTKRKWQLTVTYESKPTEEDQLLRLASNRSIEIGGSGEIDCSGSELRAYLERRGNQLYLKSAGAAPIYLNGKEIINTNRNKVFGKRIRLNCPDDRNRDFYLGIKVSK